MNNTKAQLQKTAKKLNRRIGLNPPIDINLDQAKLDLEICKRIYGLMSPIAGDRLPYVLMDLMTTKRTHSADEN